MKKVFIGVLAALMLFAFTACENNAPQTPIMGNQIEGVELVSAPDYIIGIDGVVDTAKVELNVIKNDGSKVPYTGTELKMDSNLTLTKEITPVAVQYGDLTFYVNLPAYSVEGITAVDLSGAKTKTIKSDATEISTEGITVTVSYEKGTRSGVAIEKAITKNGDKITFGGKTVADFEYKVGDEINIAEALKKEEVNETISALLDKATGSWIVTVDDSAKKITDVVLKQADDKEIFAVGTTNKINLAAIEGTITYSDGTSADIFFNTSGADRTVNAQLKEVGTAAIGKPLTGAYYIVFTTIKNAYALSEAEDSVEVSAYVVDSDGLESEVTTFDIAAIEDYPASATAALVQVDDGKGGKKNPTLDWEDPIKPESYEFTITWASNYKYEEGKEPALDGEWIPNPSKVLIETADNTNTGYDVTFTYNGYVGTADPDKEVKATGGKYYVEHAE